jgi:hypothetical protein
MIFDIVLGIIFIFIVSIQIIHWLKVIAKYKIYIKNKQFIEHYKEMAMKEMKRKKDDKFDNRGYQ